MPLLCKNLISNKPSGRFTQQSQIGIPSIFTTSHSIEAFLWRVSNMHDILEIPADTKQALSVWLWGQLRSGPGFVHILPKQQKHQRWQNKQTNKKTKPRKLLTFCFIQVMCVARSVRAKNNAGLIVQLSSCIDRRFVEHECVSSHTPLHHVSIPLAPRSAQKSVIGLYYSSQDQIGPNRFCHSLWRTSSEILSVQIRYFFFLPFQFSTPSLSLKYSFQPCSLPRWPRLASYFRFLSPTFSFRASSICNEVVLPSSSLSSVGVRRLRPTRFSLLLLKWYPRPQLLPGEADKGLMHRRCRAAFRPKLINHNPLGFVGWLCFVCALWVFVGSAVTERRYLCDC